MNQFSTSLQTIIDRAVPLLEQVSSTDFSHRPNPYKWSKKEILGHLIDSAYNNHQRFLRAEQQGNLIFGGYDQIDWVVKNNYQNRALPEIINTWATVNRHLAILIDQIPFDFLWQETSNHNFHIIGMNRPKEGATSTLAYLVWDYIFHVEHHLCQVLSEYKTILKAFNI